MSAPTILFFASAAVVMIAALVAVSARDMMRSLAGLSVALAAVIVPLAQLRAPLVGGVLLIATAVSVLLLGGLARLRHRDVPEQGERSGLYAILAGAGLLGFSWVLLATGSRQVVESGPALTEGNVFGDSSALMLEFAETQLVAGLLVGLMALCCVIAAVLTLVSDEGRRSTMMLPITHYLYLALMLFAVGLSGAVLGRSLIGALIGIQLMLAAVALCFCAYARMFVDATGQIAAFVVLLVGLCELGVIVAVATRGRGTLEEREES